MSNASRRFFGSDGRYVAAVAALALVLRVGFVCTYGGGRFLQDRWYAADAESYVGYARSLVERGEYYWNGYPARRAPLYPWFLAAVFKAGGSLVTVRMLQCILGAATCAVVFLLARRLFDGKVGRLACLLAAVYYPQIQLVGYIMSEALYTFLLVSAIAIVTAASAGGKLSHLAAGGVLTGVSALCREVSVPVAAGACGWTALAWPGGRARRLLAALVLAAAAAAAVVPWTARNWAVLGAFVPVSLSSGHTMYLGNNPAATGGTGGEWTIRDGGGYPPEEQVGPLFTLEADRKLSAMAVDYIRTHPRRFAVLAMKKLWNMWRPYYAKASVLGKAITAAMYVPAMLLAALGLGRCLGAWRRHGAALAAIAVFVFVHMIAISEIRYRYPVMPILLCYTAYGALWLAWRTGAGDRVRRSPPMRPAGSLRPS